MLITFQDGEAMVTGEASEGDEVAQEVISGIEAARYAWPMIRSERVGHEVSEAGVA